MNLVNLKCRVLTGEDRELASPLVPGDLAKTLRGEHLAYRTNDQVAQRAAMGFSPTDPQ
jgi:hypothetical protein